MRNLAISRALALLLASGLAAPAVAQCASSGLTLATTGGRLGDPFSLSLTGTPSVSGVLGLDLAPGPVATPIGNLCLGLSSALQTVPFTLSPAGTWGISGLVPPNPALAGLGVYAQAAAVDATQPGGFAVSNGAHPVLRAPRLFFIDQGSATTPTPGAGVAYGALTDSFGPVVPLPSNVEAAVAVPALGWVAVLLGNGYLLAFDAATGAIMLNQPFTTNLPSAHALAAEGTTLVVTEGTAYTAAATVQTFSLPSGAPGAVTPLPIAGVVQQIITTGTDKVYLLLWVPGYSISNTIVPVSLATGSPLQPIALGGSGFDYVVNSLVRNGIVYLLTAPSAGGTMGLNAIDASLNAAFFPNPVPLPFSGPVFGAPPLLNLGPGTLGPTLFVRDPLASALLQLSPQTLSYLAPPIPLPPGILDMKLSNGGTEWLLYSCSNCFVGGCSGGGCLPAQALLSLNASTHLLSTVGPLPSAGFGGLQVLPSATLNKAYFVSNGVVAPISTDPATPPGPAVPLPFTPQGPVLLVID